MNIHCERCGRGFVTVPGLMRHRNRATPCQAANTVVDPTDTKPFLKWVGGKTQILGQVLALFPSVIHDYYEPFLGGGSVLIGLLNEIRAGRVTVTGTIYASDVNPALVHLYKCIQTTPEDLLTEVRGLTKPSKPADDLGHPILHQETDYYALRDQYNQLADKTTLKASALFLYLNKTCFRGLFREGPRGFNVPFGHYRHPTIADPDLLRRLSVLFRPVVFRVLSFEDAISSVAAADFVYADPPYVPVTATSFVGYTTDGFDKHQVLFDRLKALPCPFLLSNADAPVVHTTFAGPYTIRTISCRRAIHARTPDARANELLITKVASL